MPFPLPSRARVLASDTAARLLAPLASLALAAAPTAAAAQGLPASPPPPQLPFLQTISINPLAIPLGIFSAEYEVALPLPGFTAAVGGTYNADDIVFGRRDRWIEGRLMYYPNEVQLKGLSVGLTLGVRRAQRVDSDDADVRPSDSAPTLGIMAGYNFLIGRQQRLVVGTGLGAARVLGDAGRTSPLSQVYPDGRILIGLAF